MYKWILIFFNLFLISSSLFASTNDANFKQFQEVFSQWTKAFNQKDLTGSCNLFDKSLTASYQGYSTKNYTTLCDGFKKVFAEKNRRYHYRFKLHQVYHSADLAAARITWYLTINEKGKAPIKVQDEGMDVLKKYEDGKWKIVNYLAYKTDKED
ncbi:MAG: hypothetical protein ACD_46C00297G0004 [uncultured bacterium]|nr:MAG: hypothetical protein ACD_46C00297G0004 [uncultured bacterium]